MHTLLNDKTGLDPYRIFGSDQVYLKRTDNTEPINCKSALGFFFPVEGQKWAVQRKDAQNAAAEGACLGSGRYGRDKYEDMWGVVGEPYMVGQ